MSERSRFSGSSDRSESRGMLAPRFLLSGVLTVALVGSGWQARRALATRAGLIQRVEVARRAREATLESDAWRLFHREYDDRLKPGAPAPEFRLPDLSGREVSLNPTARKARLTVLLFASLTGQQSKDELMDAQYALEQLRGRGLQVVGIVPTGGNDARSVANELMLGIPLLVDVEKRVSERYHVHVRPYAVVIDSTGRTVFVQPMRRLIAGVNRWRQVCEQRLGAPPSRPVYDTPTMLAGRPCPSTRARTTDGTVWSTGDQRKPFRIVFTLSKCRACEGMVQNLMTTTGPDAVIVCSGDSPDRVQYLTDVWSKAIAHPKRRVRFICDSSLGLTERFRAYTFPTSIEVDERGTIGRVRVG